MTRFIDVPALSQLVQEVGVVRFLEELTDTLRQDYLRWNEFDKSARVASHSPLGVIELMPVADAARYAFKYVNGHPRNTARGMFTSSPPRAPCSTVNSTPSAGRIVAPCGLR